MKETQSVRVKIRLTDNRPFPTDMFVEVDDAVTRNPVSAFSSLRSAHTWLTEQGYKYCHGTNGIWSK